MSRPPRATAAAAASVPPFQFYRRKDPASGQVLHVSLDPLPRDLTFRGRVASIQGDEALLTMEDARFTGHLRFSPLLDKLQVDMLLQDMSLRFVRGTGEHLYLALREPVFIADEGCYKGTPTLNGPRVRAWGEDTGPRETVGVLQNAPSSQPPQQEMGAVFVATTHAAAQATVDSPAVTVTAADAPAVATPSAVTAAKTGEEQTVAVNLALDSSPLPPQGHVSVRTLPGPSEDTHSACDSLSQASSLTGYASAWGGQQWESWPVQAGASQSAQDPVDHVPAPAAQSGSRDGQRWWHSWMGRW